MRGGNRCTIVPPDTKRDTSMLLLFILIGALAIGLPLMMILMNESPPPPEPPPRPAVVQPGNTSSMPNPPHAEASPSAGSAGTAESGTASTPATGGEVATSTPASGAAAQVGAASTGGAPSSGGAPAAPTQKEVAAQIESLKAQLAKAQASGQIPKELSGVPEGIKMPSEAELMKELQRVMEERARATK
jgi:hypothetical protein